MKKTRPKSTNEEMRTKYDFAGGVRGKYVERYRRERSVVLTRTLTRPRSEE